MTIINCRKIASGCGSQAKQDAAPLADSNAFADHTWDKAAARATKRQSPWACTGSAGRRVRPAIDRVGLNECRRLGGELHPEAAGLVHHFNDAGDRNSPQSPQSAAWSTASTSTVLPFSSWFELLP